MLRRIIPKTGPPIHAEVAAILLAGWSAFPPKTASPVSDLEATADEMFALFFDGDAGLIARWQEHEAYLRQLASQWNIAPDSYTRDGCGPFFFAEAHAREVRG